MLIGEVVDSEPYTLTNVIVVYRKHAIAKHTLHFEKQSNCKSNLVLTN